MSTYETFMSVIVVMEESDSVHSLEQFLASSQQVLCDNFTDHEIIVIVNGLVFDPEKIFISDFDRRQVRVITLPGRHSYDITVLAGLDAANGDYVCLFDVRLFDYVKDIIAMYGKAQEGYDYVLAKQPHKYGLAPSDLLARAFYITMGLFSSVRLQKSARDELLVSRRALNWLLRVRQRGRFLRETIVLSGFPATYWCVRWPRITARRTLSERVKLGWSSIIRFTNIPSQLTGLGFLLSTSLFFLMLVNALTVRFYGRDLTGSVQEIVPGWTYLVMMIAVGFSVTIGSLYFAIKMLELLREQASDDPIYIIKDIRRL